MAIIRRRARPWDPDDPGPRIKLLPPLTERIIQLGIVACYRSAAKYLVPNIHYCLGEADMLLVRRNGYVEEFEIKISIADFKHDFKKAAKHDQMKSEYQNIKTPNKFTYVVPEGMITADDVPEFAGLIFVSNAGTLGYEGKPAKFIHKEKHDWTEKIAASCSWRYISSLQKLEELENGQR